MIKYSLVIFGLIFFIEEKCFSQDMLNLLKEEPTIERVHNAFKSPRVISNHSMEMLAKGALDFRILHRFNPITNGYKDLFGLDAATMRMGFDYGIYENLTIGIGRSTYKKELDGFIKYRILWQTAGANTMPVSLIVTGGALRNGLDLPFPESDLKITNTRRMSYYLELIVGRKFTDNFSFQLSPILVHTNLVESILIPNDIFALGFGTRYKFNKRMAIVVDYTFPANKFLREYARNPLSIGVDIETGGHVFQLHFSNATGMNERAIINEKNGIWFKDIEFGFNLSRIFQIKKNKI